MAVWLLPRLRQKKMAEATSNAAAAQLIRDAELGVDWPEGLKLMHVRTVLISGNGAYVILAANKRCYDRYNEGQAWAQAMVTN